MEEYLQELGVNKQGPTLKHSELCSMSCGSLERRGVWGRMDTWTCMVESLCCSPETITTLLISYTPIRNKMFKKQNKMQKKILMSSRKNKTLVYNTGSHTLVCAVLSCFSHVRLFVTLWTVVRQPPLSMGFPGKKTGVGCHALLPGDLPQSGIKPMSLASPTLFGRLVLYH